MKKVFALTLILVMLTAMAVPAMAAEQTYTLTINNTDPGHIYEAYQIFAGTLSDDQSTLSNVVWGSSVMYDANGDGDYTDEGEYDKSAALLAALKADTKEFAIGDGNTSTLGAIFTAAEDASRVASILGTISNDSAPLDRFAEVVGAHLGNPVSTSSYSEENTNYTISGLSAGYYLVKDKDGTQEGEDDFYTKYIVRIVKSDSVNVKGGNVTVVKGINDTVGGTYDNVEDFNISETAYYKWDGTLPTNLRAYDKYWYKFTDTLPAGLDFIRIEQVYIESHTGSVSHTFLDMTDASTENDTLPAGITFAENDGVITLEFNDLLKLYPSLLSTDKVIVKYSCTVNKDALIEQANTNEVYLEYDNNPNGEGHGKTVTDVAHAFTFKITVDKFDMADPTKKLENVQFVMYYRTVDASEQIVLNYAKVVTEELIAAGEKINGKDLTSADLGKVYGWTTDKSQASILDTDANGAFSVVGLDEGTYFLEETATVSGYNKLTTPVQIDIIPTYDEEGNECSVTVEYKVDSISQGNNGVVGIRNSKGSTLPSTGGIGTTMFHVFGSILLIGAVVLLVTKKRMSAED